MLLTSITTTLDNTDVIMGIWHGHVSTTVRLTPAETVALIRDLRKELDRIEKIAALQAIRDEADKALSEVAA